MTNTIGYITKFLSFAENTKWYFRLNNSITMVTCSLLCMVRSTMKRACLVFIAKWSMSLFVWLCVLQCPDRLTYFNGQIAEEAYYLIAINKQDIGDRQRLSHCFEAHKLRRWRQIPLVVIHSISDRRRRSAGKVLEGRLFAYSFK